MIYNYGQMRGNKLKMDGFGMSKTKLTTKDNTSISIQIYSLILTTMDHIFGI